MKLTSINIKNFRSIEDVTFEIQPVDGGYSYSLIGVNESGKSSFLRAISAIDNNEDVFYPKDFFSENFPVKVALNYELTKDEEFALLEKLEELKLDEELLVQVKVKCVSVCVRYEPLSEVQKTIYQEIQFQKNIFPDYTLHNGLPVRKGEEHSGEHFNLSEFFETNLSKYFWNQSHQVVFWKSESKYLINESINLTSFATTLDKTSIPLVNCFALANITSDKIPGQINKLQNNPAEINNLQDKLGDSVTSHIRKVWPEHPVKIKFQINYPMLSFLIEDDDIKYQSRTVDQRSDGFRQFISFLLTVSAENATNKLSNSILLLDEPETHLHPKAQEYLMDELIKMTKSNDNNLVLFATHSNHMIDKDHVERCFRVSKENNKKTKLEKIELGKTTYAEVNYEVFGIAESDYHNELYGFLEAEAKDSLHKPWETRTRWNEKTKKEETVSLHTYIRHSIHHPENTKNKKVTSKDLQKSIEYLRKLRSEI